MSLARIARIAAATILTAGLLVACSDQTQACAATGPRPPAPKPYKPAQPKPGGQRTSSKIQDKPRPAKTTSHPNWKTTSKPTTWGGYNAGRNWQKPYRKGMPVAPQPVIVHHYGADYRTYPGYPGYYPAGVWPVGYGARYGCAADQEGEAQR